jgi:SAM-dependent methyltransferase
MVQNALKKLSVLLHAVSVARRATAPGNVWHESGEPSRWLVTLLGMTLTTTVAVVPPPPRTVPHFAQWVADSCPAGAQVLNVGAGADVSGGLRPLLRRRPHLVGVDPDAAIDRNPSLDERHRMSLEDFARETPDRFDVVFSVYVLEHVADPAAFVRACARVLRPGGVLLGLTLNVRQYFGATTWAMSRLHAAEWLLHRLKGDGLHHEHHFPTVYRLNSVPVISRHCADAGFTSIDFRCYDATERYQWYLPRPLRWFPPAYSRVAYAVGSAGLMGHLSFRAQLDPAEHVIGSTPPAADDGPPDLRAR